MKKRFLKVLHLIGFKNVVEKLETALQPEVYIAQESHNFNETV